MLALDVVSPQDRKKEGVKGYTKKRVLSFFQKRLWKRVNKMGEGERHHRNR